MLSATLVAAFLLPATAHAAHAATTIPVGNITELDDAVQSSCVDGDTVVLTADITSGGIVDTLCDLTIDLAGHALTLGSLGTDHKDLTITDSSAGGTGTLTATGVDSRAGIQIHAGSSLVIESGTVDAIGYSGAGIGGGLGEDGGSVTIGAGADVTASTTSGLASIVGRGYGGTAMDALTIAGTLRIGSGNLTVPDSIVGGPEVTVTSTGRIMGEPGSETTAGGTMWGDGQVHNQGVIALETGYVNGVTVTGYNSVIGFSVPGATGPDAIQVYAATIDTGYRTLPTPPAGTEWNTASDGSGTWLTSSTVLTGDLTVYATASAGGLTTLMSGCSGATSHVLTADLTVGTVDATCDLTLDLAGHSLDADSLGITGGHTLTIDDSVGGGTLTASAPSMTRAAIQVNAGNALVIDGGTVTAVGDSLGAGIGGADYTDAGDVTVNAGTVTVTGSDYGAGIGGGYGGDGGDVVIASGAVVTVSGGTSISGPTTVIGAGYGATGFGSLEVAGTLHIASGYLSVMDSDPTGPEVHVTSTGRILGAVGDETNGGAISDLGQIHNEGVISIATWRISSVTITGHNFEVSFDSAGGTSHSPVRVYAPTFDAGYRTLPAAPAGMGWNLAADGSGDWLDADTVLTGDVTVYAVTDVELTLTPSATSVDQGGSLAFTVTGTDHLGRTVDTSSAVLSSSVGTDVVDGLSVTFPHASEHTITATLAGATASVTVTVVPAAVEDEDEDTVVEDEDIAVEDTAEETAVPATEDADEAEELASTGAEPAGLLVVAVALMLAGAGLMVMRRREV
ncbi:beta strand repeat-containing protein [Demequina subtropica]|uniref:beta strand repeat-containing protein n=1 Tax=Demequina subtropica TaxID=1638989 RepID=UPI000A852E53|nr:LPXTG cell wall anchor domain-containing protein [Demequina subtropica]